MDYRKLIGDLRLASRGPNGFGICAKAADAIEALMAERDKAREFAAQKVVEINLLKIENVRLRELAGDSDNKYTVPSFGAPVQQENDK